MSVRRASLIRALAVLLGAVAIVIVLLPGDAPRAPAAGGDAASGDPQPAAENLSPAPVRPRPFTDEDPETRAGESAPALEIVVVSPPPAAPVAGARVIVIRSVDQSSIGAARTDEAGVAGLRADSGEGSAYVFAPGYPMHVATIGLEPGRRRVELPSGVTISGIVMVKDQGPGPNVPLFANPTVAPNLPSALYLSAGMLPQPSLTSERNGGFNFRGLQSGSEWSFEAGVGYRFIELEVGGAPAEAVDAPRDDVTIHVRRVPIVSGRVVGPDKRPVSGAFVHVNELTIEPRFGGERGDSTIFVSDAEGRFRAGLGHVIGEDGRVRAGAQVSVQVGDELSMVERNVDPVPETDRDLGDIELPAPRTIEFVVQDAAGHSIRDALARVYLAGQPQATSRTDDRGRGRITVGPDQKSFWVGARRHAVAEVPIPAAPLQQPLLVVLQSDAGLEVRLSSPGARPEVFHLRVTSNQQFLASHGDLNLDTILEALGGTRVSSASSGDDGTDAEFAFSREGVVTIPSIAPGSTLALEVIDSLGVIHATRSVTISHQAWETVRFDLSRRPGELRGVVRDREGEPIAGAQVSIEIDRASAADPGLGDVASGRLLYDRTGTGGRFAIGAIYVSHVVMTAEKPGYSTLVRNGVEVPRDGAELALTLDPARPFQIRFVTAEGKPVRGLDVEGSIAGLPALYAEEKEPGIYEFEDVPPEGVLTFTTSHAGREWKRSVQLARVPREDVFRFPPIGALAVRWEYRERRQDSCHVVVAAAAGDLEPVEEEVVCDGVTPGGVVHFRALLAGEYDVSLTARRERDGRKETTVLLGPERVIVATAGTTTAVIRKP